jgi:hypothetical protein
VIYHGMSLTVLCVQNKKIGKPNNLKFWEQ